MNSSNAVMSWWWFLSFLAGFNVLVLLYSFYQLNQKKDHTPPKIWQIRTWQLILSGIYTLGCGFRSILPRGDLRRIVLYDSWISCVAIGRSVATIAELSFVAQWSLILYEAGKYTKNETIRFLAKLPLPIVIIAEISSWYACLSTNYLGTAIEESLWAVAAAITVYGFYLARPHYRGIQRTFFNFGMISGIGYILYMLCIDVPEYVFNWWEAEALNKTYLSISEGFSEVCQVWHLTHAYEDWRYEFVWMSLYFSVAVWMSLLIPHMPFLDRNKLEDKG